MTHRNQITAIPASHTETANTIFQVFTIAMVGLFTLVSVVNIASQVI